MWETISCSNNEQKVKKTGRREERKERLRVDIKRGKKGRSDTKS